MQTLDNAIRLRPVKKRFGPGWRLQTEQDPENPNPTYIEAANDAAQRLAAKMGGLAQSSLFEALANIPSTAHILGGAVIGRDPEHGVIDADAASSATGTCWSPMVPRSRPTPGSIPASPSPRSPSAR